MTTFQMVVVVVALGLSALMAIHGWLARRRDEEAELFRFLADQEIRDIKRRTIRQMFEMEQRARGAARPVPWSTGVLRPSQEDFIDSEDIS